MISMQFFQLTSTETTMFFKKHHV